MKIFVTGGTGFIGKPVVKKLQKEDHQLLLLSRQPSKQSKQIKTISDNLANISKWQKALKKFKPDAAIHIAWEGLPDHNASLSQLNLEYGLNLTRALVEVGCKRMITTGSCFEYGVQKGEISENTPPKPFDAFTAAKHALRWLGQEIAKEKNMDFIWTRPFYVYGPGQHSKSLIPYFLSCVQQGKTPEIRNPNGQNDFIFVEDLAEALYQVLIKGSNGEIYNIGSGKLTSISYTAKCICDKFGIKSNFKKAEKIYKDAIGYSYADISKIKKDVGWKPKTTVEEGIKKTVDFYLGFTPSIQTDSAKRSDNSTA